MQRDEGCLHDPSGALPASAPPAGEWRYLPSRGERRLDHRLFLARAGEADLVADDVGIDGGAASAEDAAVHIIDDEE